MDELLDVSRIAVGRLELELGPVDLAEVARDGVEQFVESAAHAGSELVVNAAEPVLGHWDRGRLDQVVANLLANAIKFGAGRPIRITATETARGGQLVVEDQGIGIPLDRQSRIFDRYERAVSPRQYGGLGMGLYIVRQLVEAHDGSVEVRSTPGAGATFTVALPLGEPTPPLARCATP